MLRIAPQFAIRTALWPADLALRAERLDHWRCDPWLAEAMAPARTRVPPGDGSRRGGTTELALLKELFRSALRLSPGDYRSAGGVGIWGPPAAIGDEVMRTLALDAALVREIAVAGCDVAQTRWRIADGVVRHADTLVVRSAASVARIAVDAAVGRALGVVAEGCAIAGDDHELCGAIEALYEAGVVAPISPVLREDARAWSSAVADALARHPAAPDADYVASTIELVGAGPCELPGLSAWSALRARFSRTAPVAFDVGCREVAARAADLLARLLPDAEIRDAYVARRLAALGERSRWELTDEDRAVLCSPELALRPGLLSGSFARLADRWAMVDVDLDGVGWSWGGLATRPHVPRVTCGDVVLAPERWRVPATGEGWPALPRFVEVANLALPLPLDLEDPWAGAIVASLATKLPALELRELLPAPPELALVDARGGRVAHRAWLTVTGECG